VSNTILAMLFLLKPPVDGREHLANRHRPQFEKHWHKSSTNPSLYMWGGGSDIVARCHTVLSIVQIMSEQPSYKK